MSRQAPALEERIARKILSGKPQDEEKDAAESAGDPSQDIAARAEHIVRELLDGGMRTFVDMGGSDPRYRVLGTHEEKKGLVVGRPRPSPAEAMADFQSGNVSVLLAPAYGAKDWVSDTGGPSIKDVTVAFDRLRMGEEEHAPDSGPLWSTSRAADCLAGGGYVVLVDEQTGSTSCLRLSDNGLVKTPWRPAPHHPSDKYEHFPLDVVEMRESTTGRSTVKETGRPLQELLAELKRQGLLTTPGTERTGTSVTPEQKTTRRRLTKPRGTMENTTNEHERQSPASGATAGYAAKRRAHYQKALDEAKPLAWGSAAVVCAALVINSWWFTALVAFELVMFAVWVGLQFYIQHLYRKLEGLEKDNPRGEAA